MTKQFNLFSIFVHGEKKLPSIEYKEWRFVIKKPKNAKSKAI